jgi:hypothetical protein
MISVNTKLSRYLYAYVFIAMVSGLVWKYWGDIPGINL